MPVLSGNVSRGQGQWLARPAGQAAEIIAFGAAIGYILSPFAARMDPS